jgi:hypothetical protein
VLVFSSDRQRNQDIVLRDLRAGTERMLTTTEVNEFSPFLSTDNSKVLYYIFQRDRKPSFSFWVVNAAGGVPRQVCADCDGPLYGSRRRPSAASGEKLIDSPGVKQQLVESFPGAIGGEMEGTGVWASANRNKTE